MNYFEWFELPVSLKMDTAVLKKKYFELSKKYHPDFFTNADEDEQRKVLELSTLNTDAFNTLNDFDRRLKYVLLLKNLIDQQEKFQLPADFLMEMMELNEQISESDNPENCLQQIQTMELALFNEVENVLQLPNLNDASEKDLELIKVFYFKKKYFTRLKSQLEKKVG